MFEMESTLPELLLPYIPLPQIDPHIISNAQDLLVVERIFNARVAEQLLAMVGTHALHVGMLVPPSSIDGKAGFAWIYIQGSAPPAPYGLLAPEYVEEPCRDYTRDETHAALAWAAAAGPFTCRYVRQKNSSEDVWFDHAWLTRMARAVVTTEAPPIELVKSLALLLRERINSGPLSSENAHTPLPDRNELFVRIKRFPDQCEHSTDWATAVWRRYEKLLAELEAKVNSAAASSFYVE